MRRALYRIIAIAVAMIASPAQADQSPAEIDALKKLGSKGFFIWQTSESNTASGPVYRYDLDGSGIVNKRKIIESARNVTVSGDGSLIAYTTGDSTAGDIYLANTDGTNPRKLTQQSMPFIYWLKFDLSQNALIFSSNNESPRPEGWATSNIYFADLSGAMKLVLQNFNWGDRNYFDFLDRNQNTLSFRFRGKYTYTIEAGDQPKTFADVDDTESQSLGQRCAATLSPSGDSILLNHTDHTGMQLMSRASKVSNAWQTVTGRIENFPFKTTRFRWANDGQWIVMHEEGGAHDVYAVNIYTGDKARLTFNTEGDPHSNFGTLFLGEPATVRIEQKQNALRIYQATPATGAAIYSINGRLLQTSVFNPAAHKTAAGIHITSAGAKTPSLTIVK